MSPFYLGIDLHLKRTFLVMLNAEKADKSALNSRLVGAVPVPPAVRLHPYALSCVGR